MLEGKQIYREASEIKLSRDTPLPEGERNASDDVYFPHILVQYQEPIDNIKFFAFGDASIHGMFAAVCAVVTQASGVTQGLIADKSCLAKKSLTIPRLELVSGHITVNLTTNVRVALAGFSMTKDI